MSEQGFLPFEDWDMDVEPSLEEILGEVSVESAPTVSTINKVIFSKVFLVGFERVLLKFRKQSTTI